MLYRITSSFRSHSAFIVALAMVVGTPAVGIASLIGDEVNFQCTNCGPRTNDDFVVVEGASELSLFNQLEIDVEAETLRVDWIFTSSSIISDLNLVWSDLDWVGSPGEIVGVHVDPTSTWGLGATVSFTADSVTLTNNNDRTVIPGDFWMARLEVNHSVPEPSTYAMAAAALAGLVLIKLRRRVG